MFKVLARIFIFSLILSFFSCASVSEKPITEAVLSASQIEEQKESCSFIQIDTNPDNSPEAMMWNTLPINDHPVFFAAAPRQIDRENELAVCVADAAKQASMFYVLSAKALTIEQRVGRSTGYHGDVSISYDIEFASALINEIEIIETFQDSGGTYIRAFFESIKCPPIHYNLGNKSREPSWITSPPVLNGYYSAVGTVRRRNLFTDSLYSLDGQALVELLKQIAITIKSQKREMQTQSGAILADESSTQVSSGIIKGFFIISRWAPSNGTYYYALAVCTEGIAQ